jgi:ubiquitin carboxyl-terminal hydrolase 4/11
MPGLVSGDSEKARKDIADIEHMPYEVRLVNVAGYREPCWYCEDRSCHGCPLKYNEDLKILDLLKAAMQDSNETLYSNNRMKAGKEVQLEVIWHFSFEKALFASLSTAQPWERTDSEADRAGKGGDQVTLKDCLNEFKQTETLDEENKWYCNKCKDHVIATKTMEIYRTPPILIITLKRFRTGRSRYGFGVGGSKLDTLVDFPLNGLDMRDFVLCNEQKHDQKTKLIYDCYAVSNHMGGVGGGHYTAYGVNPTDDEWYSFNDSWCQKVGNKE